MNSIQFDQGVYKKLAPREIEVAIAAKEGLSIKATADKLSISHKTVQNYRRSIIWKLTSKNMTGAVGILMEAGII